LAYSAIFLLMFAAKEDKKMVEITQICLHPFDIEQLCKQSMPI